MKVSAQELFATAKPKLVSEEISWDGNTATVFFQRLTMEESSDLARPFLKEDGSGIDKDRFKNYQAESLATAIRDENGAKIVTAADVLAWDGGFYSAMVAAGSKHNPSTNGAVEEAAKNSDSTPSNATS